MGRVKVLKGKAAIRKARRLYIDASNEASKLIRDCICPNCGDETYVELIEECVCGKLICSMCQSPELDEVLCQECYDEPKTS